MSNPEGKALRNFRLWGLFVLREILLFLGADTFPSSRCWCFVVFVFLFVYLTLCHTLDLPSRPLHTSKIFLSAERRGGRMTVRPADLPSSSASLRLCWNAGIVDREAKHPGEKRQRGAGSASAWGNPVSWSN